MTICTTDDRPRRHDDRTRRDHTGQSNRIRRHVVAGQRTALLLVPSLIVRRRAPTSCSILSASARGAPASSHAGSRSITGCGCRCELPPVFLSNKATNTNRPKHWLSNWSLRPPQPSWPGLTRPSMQPRCRGGGRVKNWPCSTALRGAAWFEAVISLRPLRSTGSSTRGVLSARCAYRSADSSNPQNSLSTRGQTQPADPPTAMPSVPRINRELQPARPAGDDAGQRQRRMRRLDQQLVLEVGDGVADGSASRRRRRIDQQEHTSAAWRLSRGRSRAPRHSNAANTSDQHARSGAATPPRRGSSPGSRYRRRAATSRVRSKGRITAEPGEQQRPVPRPADGRPAAQQRQDGRSPHAARPAGDGCIPTRRCRRRCAAAGRRSRVRRPPAARRRWSASTSSFAAQFRQTPERHGQGCSRRGQIRGVAFDDFVEAHPVLCQVHRRRHGGQ